MTDMLATLSVWMIPLLLLAIPLVGVVRRVKVYEAFVEGAAEGFQTAIRVMPYLVAMMVAINIFRASGAMGALAELLSPVCVLLGIPADIVPLAIMRPLSGSGSLGLTTEIIHTFGPDSFIGKLASVIIGSTDTTFYILTVYFGAIGITKPRYSLFVGLFGDLIGFFASVYFCQKIFG